MEHTNKNNDNNNNDSRNNHNDSNNKNDNDNNNNNNNNNIPTVQSQKQAHVIKKAIMVLSYLYNRNSFQHIKWNAIVTKYKKVKNYQFRTEKIKFITIIKVII